MKRAILLAVLALSIGTGARADATTPAIDMSIFFLPVAQDSPDLLNFGMFDPDQSQLAGTTGFTYQADPFTLSLTLDGRTQGPLELAMTFLPGTYGLSDRFAITSIVGTAFDLFSMNGGTETFVLPQTIVPFARADSPGFLWVADVPVVIQPVPEPSVLWGLEWGLFALVLFALAEKVRP